MPENIIENLLRSEFENFVRLYWTQPLSISKPTKYGSAPPPPLNVKIIRHYVIPDHKGLASLTYNRTGLLDRPGKAWLQKDENMRVFAHEVTW